MKIKVYMKEIQYRLFFAFMAFLLNLSILLYYKEELILLLGLHQSNKFPHFITTNLPEVFFCLLKLSLFVSFYITFPLIIIQSLFFIVPALYKYEYKTIKKFVVLSCLLYLSGSIFTFTIFLPYCWKFFSAFELTYENNGISLSLETRFHEYLNFFIDIFFTLNIFTNLCLFFSFIILKFPLKLLLQLRKVVYFLAFIIATIITPPDILSQIFVGLILLIIYETFIFYVFLTYEYEKGE